MNISANMASPLATSPSARVNSVAHSDEKTNELSEQDLQHLQKLKARDRVVRAHESAHVAAGGSIVRGGAHFSFQRGPDGAQYAIGGEVKIDTSKVAGDPEATLQKAEMIQAAALAPAQPSSQDRTVAAKAAQMAIEARAEINQQRSNENASPANKPSFTSVDETDTSGNLLDLTA